MRQEIFAVQPETDYFAGNSGKGPTDYQKRLHDARAAARAGRFEEALEGYIWFHENSADAVGPGQFGLSIALADWVELGRSYPPARTALEEIRDLKTKTLLHGIRDVMSFTDVVSINGLLGCELATYELFVSLNSSFPLLARNNYAELALPAIVNSRDFELARQLVPHLREQLLSFVPPTPGDVHYYSVWQTLVADYVRRLRVVLMTLRTIGEFENAERFLASAMQSIESAEFREAVRAALEAAE